MPFWEALCRSGLADIHISRGHLSKAGDELASCRQIFRDFNVAAPLAGALIGSGWLETYRANYGQGLAYLEQAEILINELGNKNILGTCYMHLGEIYLEMGRYQQSLHYLEQALDTFQGLKSPGRLAECGLRLARCWTYLGLPNEALDTLFQVEKNAEEAKQKNIFPYLYIRQAESMLLADRKTDAVDALQKAILAALEFEDKTGAALAQRLLGEAQVAIGQLDEAAKNIETAEKIFTEVGMVIDQADCQIAWGQYYQEVGDFESARTALQLAATLGQNLAPDVIWKAEAGLASLAEMEGHDAEAQAHYRQVIRALVRLRQDMWQPVLGGYLLKQALDTLNKALRLAVKVGSAEDVVYIIEAGKAQVIANLFKRPHSAKTNGHSPKLADLAADIRWRQEKARASTGNSFLPKADFRKLRLETQKMVIEYDKLRGRTERRNRRVAGKIDQASGEFALDRFRTAANQKFGANWLALDYYLTDKHLTCVMMNDQMCEFIDVGYSGPVRLAFEELEHVKKMGRWRQPELQIFGRWLLPQPVLDTLTPNTTLLIAPHGKLHQLPWAALTVEGQPLVTRAIPVVVPSMESLMALIARSEKEFAIEKGLLLAVSEFNRQHNPLPQTVNEVESLKRLFPASTALIDKTATWEGLLDSMNGAGQSDYSFLHIASHAFADKVSGRLSGLALYDRDVWLDELWDCAPLPPLVTLSACSGSQSRLYEGDEQVGLATTCLAAGANHVVASLWRINDKAAADLMRIFYTHLLLGSSVALALAKAQRAAINSGQSIPHWAGFRCNGLPS